MYRIHLLAKVARVRVLTPCPLVHRSGDGIHAASTAVRNLSGLTHPGRVSYMDFVREFGSSGVRGLPAQGLGVNSG